MLPPEKKFRKPKLPESERRIVFSISLSRKVLGWLKEWAKKHDRSVSWSITYMVKEHMGRDQAEKYFGKKVVERKMAVREKDEK